MKKIVFGFALGLLFVASLVSAQSDDCNGTCEVRSSTGQVLLSGRACWSYIHDQKHASGVCSNSSVYQGVQTTRGEGDCWIGGGTDTVYDATDDWYADFHCQGNGCDVEIAGHCAGFGFRVERTCYNQNGTPRVDAGEGFGTCATDTGGWTCTCMPTGFACDVK